MARVTALVEFDKQETIPFPAPGLHVKEDHVLNLPMTKPPSPLSVTVAYSDPLVRAGLLSIFARDRELHVTTPDISSDEAITRIAVTASILPTVVVADYETAIAILHLARSAANGKDYGVPRVLVITPRDRESEIRHALKQGAQGYLPLGGKLEEMNDAIRALHRGARHLGQSVAQRLAESFSHEPLTARETAVLRLVAGGAANKSIARDLDIALGTVKAHVKSILAKLEAKTRTEAAAISQRRGLFIEDSEPHQRRTALDLSRRQEAGVRAPST